ncbi:MAG: winged helix-turn-helix domain-containing protein [archaeon]|jgi:DNA-binding transcriptional ArsR family regulator
MIFMDQRVVLDEKSFKALSADSRINILKNLSDRRRTLTELSQKLNLGGSTIKEHCEILVDAELIKQIDEGRKWKYYELTSKGKQIVHPSLMEEVKVLIVLSLATVVVGGFIYMLLGSFGTMASAPANYAGSMMDQTVLKTTAIAERAIDGTGMGSTVVQGITSEFFAISIMLSLIIGMLLGWIFTRKR